MSTPTHPYVARVGVWSISSVLVQFPVVCFTLAFLTDILYWRTANLMWQNFSSWLIFAGLVVGALAVLAGIIEFFLHLPERRRVFSWIHVSGSAIVLALAVCNSVIHAKDGWIAVVPGGIALSAATVVMIIVTAWFGRSPTFPHGAGASNGD